MSGLRQHRDLLIATCTEAIDSMIARSETLDVGSDDVAIFDTQFELEVTCPSMPEPSRIVCHIVKPLNVAGDATDYENLRGVLDPYRQRRDDRLDDEAVRRTQELARNR